MATNIITSAGAVDRRVILAQGPHGRPRTKGTKGQTTKTEWSDRRGGGPAVAARSPNTGKVNYPLPVLLATTEDSLSHSALQEEMARTIPWDPVKERWQGAWAFRDTECVISRV